MPHVRRAAQLESPPLTFDGGFNYLDQSRVKANQLTSGRNWWQDEDGVVRPRPGNKVWNAAALGAEFQGLWEYRRASDQVNRLIAYAGGTLFKGDDTTKSFTLLLTDLNTGARGFLVQAQDLFWWCNGKDAPRVSDASTITRIGISNPAAAPTVALVAVAGNLPLEAHTYRYAYVREEGGIKVREGNPSAASAAVTPVSGSQQIDVTVTASTDAQVTHIYIYRTSATTVPEAKFVAKVTNTTQTYRDNIAVGGLGGFAFWETSGGLEDHGSPPTDLFAVALHRDGRMYGWSTKSRLLYTRANTFHYWPGASGGVSGAAPNGIKLIISEDDGDEGQAILSEGDDLWLLKRYHAYRLLGDGPTQDDGLVGSWRVEQVPTMLGCAARASAALGPAGAFWLSDAGPVQVEPRSGLPRLIGEGILPWLETTTDITKAVGWVWKWYYFLFVPVAGGKWEGHVFDVRNRSWWPLEDMHALAFASREVGTLVWGGILEVDKPANGVVYEWDQQVSDNGQAVTAELTSRVIDVAPRAWKLLRKAILACEGRPGATFTARLIPDQSPSYIERELKLSGLTGVRMLKPFPGTKQLQGWAFQLYLRSVNLTARPAIYYWQQLIHTLNREALSAPSFTATYPDPDPTVGLVEGTFGAGTHTNTQVVGGKVTLAEETTWALAYNGSRAKCKEAYLASGKLIILAGDGPAGGPVDDILRLYVFDGGTWTEVVASPANYHLWRVLDDFQARHLQVVGGAVFIVPGEGTAGTHVRRTTDLTSFADYGTALPSGTVRQWCIGLRGGVLYLLDVFETVSALRDAGSGTWVTAGNPGGGFPRELCDTGDYAGFLWTYNLGTDANPWKKWDGSTWTELPGPGTGILGTYVIRVSTITNKLYLASQKIWEWNGSTWTERIDFGGGRVVRELVEVTEPTGVKALYAVENDRVYRSYDGVTWTNLGQFSAGKTGYGMAIYKGRRYVAGGEDGDVYSNFFFKTTGTYRLDERDLLATKTAAQVRVTATVPAGATLETRLGYALITGGPYTFTAFTSTLNYQVSINGRFLVVEFQMTGDGTKSPEVDEVEILAR